MYAFTIKAHIHKLLIGLIVKPLNTAMTRFEVETITGSGCSIIVSKEHDLWQLEKEGSPCLNALNLVALGKAIEKELKIRTKPIFIKKQLL
jgi:hypothetical protein